VADLLIAIALDFAGDHGPAEQDQRIARTMTLGKAGDVRFSGADGALMLARGQAPVRNPRVRRVAMTAAADGGLTLFAGRLFEREGLRNALGAGSGSRDDAALYAAAHMAFGEACDSRVTGNYAAIRWFPARREVRIARSPTSDHPIHLWRQGTRLVAASVPRVLFAAGASQELDDERLADLLLRIGPEGADSIYRGCERVAAASVYRADRTGARHREYWSIAHVPRVRFGRDSEYVEAVEEQFARSMKAHLADIRAPAISLSGGLDSQAVAGFAVPQLAPGTVLRSYTSVPMPGWTPAARPWRFGDEGDHVRALAAMYPQIVPTFLTAEDRRFGEGLEARNLLSAWPPANEMNAHWGDACYARAAADGCDALFRGDMGNTGFSYDGLTGFPSWLARGQWLRLLSELRASDDPRPLWRRFASLAAWPHVPLGLKRWRDRNNPHDISPFASWCPMREDAARQTGALARARKPGSEFDGYDYASAGAWRNRLWRLQMSGSPEVYLGYQLAHGIALPDPSAFVPLLELCAGIPDEQYLRAGTDRWLARRLLRGRVPDLVVDERRTGAQASDWPLRFAREREGLLTEIGRMKQDDRLAGILDLERMERDLTTWDGTDDVAAGTFWTIQIGLARGLATARYIQHVEGRNVG
jgi:asparagine synthase (glutamine-hydrolysing)